MSCEDYLEHKVSGLPTSLQLDTCSWVSVDFVQSAIEELVGRERAETE